MIAFQRNKGALHVSTMASFITPEDQEKANLWEIRILIRILYHKRAAFMKLAKRVVPKQAKTYKRSRKESVTTQIVPQKPTSNMADDEEVSKHTTTQPHDPYNNLI
jgi:hypothetical protein